MEPSQLDQNIPPPALVEVEPKKRTWKILLFFLPPLFTICCLAILGFYLLIPQKKPSVNHQPSSETTINKLPTNTLKSVRSVFTQISNRQLTDNIDGGGNGEFSFGFLNSKYLDSKPTAKLNFLQAFAAEDGINYPLIVYALEKTKIVGFNIATGERIILLDLSKYPNISIKNGTAIDQVAYLNKSKKIIFEFQERLDNNPDNDETIRNNLEKYKVSINIYDLKTQNLSEIVSATDSAGGIASWSDLNVSPDEDILFFFVNPQTNDLFPNIQTVQDKNGRFPTYFFYDLKNRKLNSFKLEEKLSGPSTVVSSISQNDSSAILGYTQFPTGKTFFTEIYPDGTEKKILENGDGLNHYEKVYFNKTQNRIYYIGSSTTLETNSVFGYYDIASNSFNKVTPNGFASLNFIPDSSGGIVYDSFLKPDNKINIDYSDGTIYYYDKKSEESRKITHNSIVMLSYLGDYSHLLVGNIGATYGATLYDMDLATGTPVVLNYGPFIVSPWTRRGKFTSISVLPILQQLRDRLKTSTDSASTPNH